MIPRVPPMRFFFGSLLPVFKIWGLVGSRAGHKFYNTMIKRPFCCSWDSNRQESFLWFLPVFFCFYDALWTRPKLEYRTERTDKIAEGLVGCLWLAKVMPECAKLSGDILPSSHPPRPHSPLQKICLGSCLEGSSLDSEHYYKDEW